MLAFSRHAHRCGGRLARPHACAISVYTRTGDGGRLARPHARAISVYTRTGDGGTSSLYNGERRPKDDAVFEALGALDELNAAVGMAYMHCDSLTGGARATGPLAPQPGLEGLGWLLPQLTEVQAHLLDVGSAAATPQRTSESKRLARVSFNGEAEAGRLETYIDAMDAHLPPLTVFILPGGGAGSASLHVARAVCRRAERRVFTLVSAGDCPASAAIYLNRLSDYFFVAARYAAASAEYPEARRERRKRAAEAEE